MLAIGGAQSVKVVVGNSDTHRQSQTIGVPQTVVRAEALSTAAIIAGYRAGRCWITDSRAVDLTFTATLGAATGTCGDRVPSAAGDQVAVHLEVSGLDDGCVATLSGPGTLTFGTAVASGGAVTLDATVPGGTAFVRAQVRREPSPNDAMVALTNPVFLTAAG